MSQASLTGKQAFTDNYQPHALPKESSNRGI